jgi:hypothetical protein
MNMGAKVWIQDKHVGRREVTNYGSFYWQVADRKLHVAITAKPGEPGRFAVTELRTGIALGSFFGMCEYKRGRPDRNQLRGQANEFLERILKHNAPTCVLAKIDEQPDLPEAREVAPEQAYRVVDRNNGVWGTYCYEEMAKNVAKRNNTKDAAVAHLRPFRVLPPDAPEKSRGPNPALRGNYPELNRKEG